MGYFDEEKNVQQYIEMTKDYEGEHLINTVRMYLSNNSTLLELGMGPGKDLDILSKYFDVTGSDNSKVFLDLYRASHNEVDLLEIDAIKMNTERKFDCIYSNKVLHHLRKNELLESIENQNNVLKQSGLLFHTFWRGNSTEEFDGLLFVYYQEQELKRIFGGTFDIIAVEKYTEAEENDSVYVVARKK